MVRRRQLTVAAGFAIAIIIGAPFIGEIRTALAAAFPRQFRALIVGVVAVSIGTALLVAMVRIRGPRHGRRGADSARDGRALRHAALVTALLAGLLFARANSSGNPDVDAVEAFHFVEYGILTLMFYVAWRPIEDVSVFVLPLLAGLLVGTLDEWFQWFIPFRVGELRDVALDGAAVACGLLFSISVDPPAHFTLAVGRGSAIRIGALAVVLTVVFALFFQAAFLGYEIRDPQLGVFRSRYTAAALDAASRERAEQWRSRPPLEAGRVSREDQYLSEALWHVRRRNGATALGDAFTAWRENRILETFYAPVLDTPTYLSRSGARWPAAQRLDTERRAQDEGGPYVSDAEPYRIYVWPTWMFWTAIAIVIAATIMLCITAEWRTSDGRETDS